MSQATTQKPLVVALGNPKYAGKEYLQKFKETFDFEILDAYDRATTKAKLPALASSRPIYAFLIRMGTPPYEPFDEDLFGPLLPSCKIITSASAGYNEFPVDWMTKNKIWFCNTRDAVSEATADMAMFLILAVLRNTTVAERQAREGSWKANIVPSRDPTGLTLGIVGAGAIGKLIAWKARLGFNMKVVYHNRTQLPAEDEAKHGLTYYAKMNDMLAISDVVSISCPLNAETTNLISGPQFAAMKDGAFFVNTSRGPVVDEDAMIKALESGKITRAGLDVFHNEPNIKDYFKTSDKVVLQPHMGGLTDVAFQKSERECFENIRSLFETGRPVAPVNELNVK